VIEGLCTSFHVFFRISPPEAIIGATFNWERKCGVGERGRK